VAKLLAGEPVAMMETELRGASNAKAKRELGWTLRYPSWREGFVAAYGSTDRMRDRIASQRPGHSSSAASGQRLLGTDQA
jgi:hypothetical protein